MQDTTILHLTDLHFGTGAVADEDLKVRIPDAARAPLKSRLADYLQAMPAPDFVVISGDVTNRGDRSGFEETREWILKLVDEDVFPPRERIIIVPGNHDVTRASSEGFTQAQRFELFYEHFGKILPHAYLPELDPRPSAKLDWKTLDGGSPIRVETTLDESRLMSSCPFILDAKRGVLIYAFNSSLACGALLPVNKDFHTAIEVVLDSVPAKERDAQRDKLIDASRPGRTIDAGLIGAEQLDRFASTMRSLKRHLAGNKFNDLTKVATLHHHISHLWDHQLELKAFESVIDAAQLRMRLLEFGFDLVLHGHKHTNHVGVDTVSIPLSETSYYKPLCIVSGGTVCGYPRLNHKQTFKQLKLDHSQPDRTQVLIEEIPLVDAGDPHAAMAKEKKVFQVVLEPTAGPVHDLSMVKEELDALLVNRYFPTEKDCSSGEHFRAPVKHRELLAEAARFVWTRRIECPKTHTYIDVILAPQKLGFEELARVHWMLAELPEVPHGGPTIAAALIVGSLVNTHFGLAADAARFGESVDKLRSTFKPAIDAGRFKILIHHFTQNEIDDVIEGLSNA